MSIEDDTELRDLVTQTLEVNGCFAKIRAQLRASIFLALDQDEEVHKREPMLNKKVRTHLQTQEGRLMFCIIREFLEFFNLDFSISVYEPESYLGSGYIYEGRQKILSDLGIKSIDENFPVLLQIMRLAQLKNNNTKTNIKINLSKIQNGDYNDTHDKDCKEDRSVQDFAKSAELNNATEDDKSNISSEQFEHSAELSNSSEDASQLSGNILESCIHDNNKFNKTFDISNPSMELKQNGYVDAKADNNEDDKHKTLEDETGNASVEIVQSPRSVASTKSNYDKDDTFEGTSSLVDDSIKEHETAEKIKSKQRDKSQNDEEKSPKTTSESVSVESEFSPPILKDSKSHSKFDTSFDKLKLSPQKTEKLKNKSSLSSLSDLPPLPLNKSRNDSLLLPSLYSKEFREKCNSKEVDKFPGIDFDSLDNYEEDFMSNSELELSNKNDFLASENSEVNLLEELQQVDISSVKHIRSTSPRVLNLQNVQPIDSNKVEGKVIKPSLRFSEHSNKHSLETKNIFKENSISFKTDEPTSQKLDSSASSSNSEDLNVDDILNSK